MVPQPGTDGKEDGMGRAKAPPAERRQRTGWREGHRWAVRRRNRSARLVRSCQAEARGAHDGQSARDEAETGRLLKGRSTGGRADTASAEPLLQGAHPSPRRGVVRAAARSDVTATATLTESVTGVEGKRAACVRRELTQAEAACLRGPGEKAEGRALPRGREMHRKGGTRGSRESPAWARQARHTTAVVSTEGQVQRQGEQGLVRQRRQGVATRCRAGAERAAWERPPLAGPRPRGPRDEGQGQRREGVHAQKPGRRRGGA